MLRTLDGVGKTQLEMPGMPKPKWSGAGSGFRKMIPGQKVMYLGRVTGGPNYGARGVVRRILARTALVDLGTYGAWHIPYYFLALPSRMA